MADTYTFSDQDPRLPSAYQLLISFATNDKYPAAIKVAAAAAASKVEPKYLHRPIDLPAFTTIQEAEAFKLQLSQQELRNEYDQESVNRAIARIDNWINDQRADAHAARQDVELELKRLAADASDQPQIIKITGGLPELPGTNVTMPGQQPDLLNGHGPVIEHQPEPVRYYRGQPVRDPKP
jgi:hypothetical protein